MAEPATLTPSAAGILRHPSGSKTPQDAERSPRRGSVTWDEQALAAAEAERAKCPRMKIEMPDTPFLYYDSRAEPAEQFRTAEKTDRVDGPGGPISLTFDASHLQQRLGLVKLLQEAEATYERGQAEDEPAAAAGGRGDDSAELEVVEGGARRTAATTVKLLECHRTVTVRGTGRNCAAAADVWVAVTKTQAGCTRRIATGLDASGTPEVTLTFRNPYVALEVDRVSGASVPASIFEAKRKALYRDQGVNFKKMLAAEREGRVEDASPGSPSSAASPCGSGQ
eukprot:TRINITY_DN50648_c0_g1_i1.p1 TRINITY_DN50648_c0_g1~~TRINITY_DN50648_c0_g1_i1.p1  ORF type:complete len:309 (+),score=127.33 TRINITY_DN50648_c0_g1_i1:83-928(+)